MTVGRFDDWLLSQGLDRKTVRIYRGKLARALEVCGEQGWDLRHMGASELRALADHFPHSASSWRQLRTALVHYWEMEGVKNPARAIRVPKKPRGHYRGLEPDDARLLAKAAKGWWPEGGAVLCGLYLGLRRDEIARLRWDRFDRDMEWVTILGKHDKTRTLPVHDKLRGELAPNMSAYVYAFPGHRQRQFVHPATIWDWIGKVADTAGVGVVAPHQLRHTCLATMNDKTEDLRTTQEFAGHARPETTAVYTRTTDVRLTKAVAQLDFLD